MIVLKSRSLSDKVVQFGLFALEVYLSWDLDNPKKKEKDDLNPFSPFW